MISGKIFDDTPSGKKLTEKKEKALQTFISLGHEIETLKGQRISNDKRNCIVFKCAKCLMEFQMDFITGTEYGSALEFNCRNKPWL